MQEEEKEEGQEEEKEEKMNEKKKEEGDSRVRKMAESSLSVSIVILNKTTCKG